MSALPKAQVEQLKLFVQMLKSKPDILHDPALDFLRDFIVSMGGTIPPKKQVWTLAQFLAFTLFLFKSTYSPYLLNNGILVLSVVIWSWDLTFTFQFKT